VARLDSNIETHRESSGQKDAAGQRTHVLLEE